MIAATGPFTTSDNLEMGALRDLMEVVKQEKPDLLVLVKIVIISAGVPYKLAISYHFGY